MSDARSAPASDGDRFGDYELVRYLTAGGMADLYLARHPRFDFDLVVKRIQTRYADHTRVVRMFIDEGRIAQALDHPNIVKVVDVGQHAGTYYIAMEYIQGHDLIAIARRGVETGRFLPRPLAVAIVAQVATGLAYAHTRTDDKGHPLSIVHCDVSPGNVVVSLRGTAKVVDFGIARATIALREQDGVAGKYNYMAPEQIRGERVDARADLFALGVILYELTVGKRLFKGPAEQVMRKVCDEPIPAPREVRPDFPASLEQIIGRLLARDPRQRFSSAAEVRHELRNWLQVESALMAGGGELEPGMVLWGKREIARYLRELFRAPRTHVTDDESLAEVEDEELELERAMPVLDEELVVDPEDEPADASEHFSRAFDVESTRPERDDETPLPAPLAPLVDLTGEGLWPTGALAASDDTPLPAPSPPLDAFAPGASTAVARGGTDDVSDDGETAPIERLSLDELADESPPGTSRSSAAQVDARAVSAPPSAVAPPPSVEEPVAAPSAVAPTVAPPPAAPSVAPAVTASAAPRESAAATASGPLRESARPARPSGAVPTRRRRRRRSLTPGLVAGALMMLAALLLLAYHFTR